MNVHGPGSVYQLNKISQSVVKFGQANEASKVQSARQMESITTKQQDMAIEVIDNAVRMENIANQETLKHWEAYYSDYYARRVYSNRFKNLPASTNFIFLGASALLFSSSLSLTI